MLFTLVWAIGFFLFMLFCLVLLMLQYLIRWALGQAAADTYNDFTGKWWGRIIVLSTGSKVTVTGLEKLCPVPNVCYICNHQSFFDIPLLLGWIGRIVGFVAKQELKHVPILSQWMTAIHCVFIDRSNPRKGMASLHKAADYLKQGHSLAIFPEGSRSKSSALGEFRQGSLKLAYLANAVIQPVTISGSWKIYEEHSLIKSAPVSLTIHAPIFPDDPLYSDKIQLVAHLTKLMQDNL